MSWFHTPDLPALLEREHALLDGIFGQGAHEVESSDPVEARVRSGGLELELVYDRRGGLIMTNVTVTGEWGEVDSAEGWARFLGEESVPLPRTRSGWIAVDPEEQVRAELERVARLAQEIFSDPQKTRDAVHFVRGYRIAYNDWASGAWDRV